MEQHLAQLRQWVGRTRVLTDRLTVARVSAMTALLDHELPPSGGTELPPCWHWLYFLPTPRQSELDIDGHTRRGDFLPPVPLPRRMWAGSRLRWYSGLRVGARYTQTSRIVAVEGKMGRSGQLVFVTVRHEVGEGSQIALVEEQDIVYRDQPVGEASERPSAAAPATCEWSRCMQADPTLLFRFSALTFNAHRIHYDRQYAMDVEGYPGLVVQAPLLATLLLDLLRIELPQARISEFTFRALKPVFDLTPFALCASRGEHDRVVKLWVKCEGGELAMTATAQLH